MKKERRAYCERSERSFEERPAPPVVAAGSWWALGRHLLYCGDTSAGSAFEAALREVRPVLAFADPPYGAGVADWDAALVWDHDYLAEVCARVLVTPGQVNLDEFFRRVKMPYRWTLAGHVTNGMTRGKVGFANWIAALLFARSEVKVFLGGQDFYAFAISPRMTDGAPHKGRKPREFVGWLLSLYSASGDLVVDPFAGTGTTLIVAEELSRACVTGELDPSSCGAIIRRWESFSGGTAVEL